MLSCQLSPDSHVVPPTCSTDLLNFLLALTSLPLFHASLLRTELSSDDIVMEEKESGNDGAAEVRVLLVEGVLLCRWPYEMGDEADGHCLSPLLAFTHAGL